MRAPAFWDRRRPDWRARLLAPLGALYAGATAWRLARGTPARAGAPVICVGNISAGGTGKTPAVIALAERLRGLGHDPHVVSRGHGGTEAGPLEVDPARHGAGRVGDEPLLLAAFARTWVARDRAAGAAAAVAAGATAVLLDDGFQDPALRHDLAIVVVDAEAGFGNGMCLPAGPLREPPAAGLARADLLVSVGGEAAQARFGREARLPGGLPRVEARLEPLRTGAAWAGARVVAFAGIGRPGKFFDTLRGLGADIARAVELGDHEAPGAALLSRLEREARAAGARLVTTEKDAARLPPAFRPKVIALPVRLRFGDAAALDAALAALPGAGAGR